MPDDISSFSFSSSDYTSFFGRTSLLSTGVTFMKKKKKKKKEEEEKGEKEKEKKKKKELL